jgi:hypothetical protein
VPISLPKKQTISRTPADSDISSEIPSPIPSKMIQLYIFPAFQSAAAAKKSTAKRPVNDTVTPSIMKHDYKI